MNSLHVPLNHSAFYIHNTDFVKAELSCLPAQTRLMPYGYK